MKFENLKVFQKAYRVSLEIHEASLKFPKIEQFGLADQLRRASKSICANLAEGFGKKRSQSDFNRFIGMAIGSADEMRVWLRYCYDLRYIDESRWNSWRNDYEEIAKMLQGLGKSVRNTDV